jgi:hypothetical protein
MENKDEAARSSLVPQLFESQDIEGLKQLKSITDNIATYSTELVKAQRDIRVSDNKVTIMSQKIAADKEKWHDLLTHVFSGRDKAIDAFINQIENGVQEKNNELILKAMDGLSNIVAASPWPTFDSFNKLIESGEDLVI